MAPTRTKKKDEVIVLEGPDGKEVTFKRKQESPQAKAQREILELLNELGGQTFSEEIVERGGDKIRLPEDMKLGEAWKFLRNQEKAEEDEMTFRRDYPYRPWDGAWCAWNALRRVFGAASHTAAIRMGFFGPEKEPPQFLTIPSAVGKTTQVPWGGLRIPALPDVLFNLDQKQTPEGPIFHIYAQGPRKHKAAVEGVFHLIEVELRERSLYRGQAIDGETMPHFIDLSSVDRHKVVYAEEANEQLSANVWAQIEHSELLNTLGLPRKRAVLLHGEWGTGKTLAAILTAQVAVANGWTFIRARPGQDSLNEVIGTARLYAPAVVFFEDIDVIANPDSLDSDQASQLLDAFDGMAAKGQDVMIVLTTNHIDRIHAGMIRPGRLDALIQLGALDDRGIVQLLLATIPDEMVDAHDVSSNHAQVADAHADYTPAFVVESAGRAIRHAVARAGDATNGDIRIKAEDLVHSGNGLRNQLELMKSASTEIELPALDQQLNELVRDQMDEALEEAGLRKER